MSTFNDPKIEEIKSLLKREFNPKRLFLFGSRANGTARSDSDYDLVMVVSKYKKNSLEDMSRAKSLVLKQIHVIADIFIYTESEFSKWKVEFSSIPETAVNTGQEIDL